MGNVVIFGVILLEKNNKIWKILFTVLTYLVVAAVAVCITFVVTVQHFGGISKLEQLESLILERFIGKADKTEMEDAAAAT